MIDAVKNIDYNVDDTDGTHTAATSVTTIVLSSVNNSSSVPDLSNDGLVALQLKDTAKNMTLLPI